MDGEVSSRLREDERKNGQPDRLWMELYGESAHQRMLLWGVPQAQLPAKLEI